MKKRILISSLVVAVVTLAVVRWTFDGLVWALRPARLGAAA
jgi:hypothetical protein